jgi:RNA polymerase sigma-70 factor (ECF subfamily)
MWRVFGDMSFRQIGALFGKTDNWACVTYHRARKMIKSRLEEEDK